MVGTFRAYALEARHPWQDPPWSSGMEMIARVCSQLPAIFKEVMEPATQQLNPHQGSGSEASGASSPL